MITASSNDFGEVNISINGLKSEGVCFEKWNYHRDYNGIDISLWIGESLKEISHRFENNNGYESHTFTLDDFRNN